MSAMYRYVAYTPNGDRLGPLPVPLEAEFSSPMNEVSACTLSYRRGSPGADFLSTPVEVAVEASRDEGATWLEVPNGRYMRMGREYEKVAQADIQKYILPGYGWQLNRALQWETENLNADGKRPFLSATVGVILKTLIDEAQARGTIPGLTYTFTTTVDSAGVPWDKVITIYYEPGLSIYQILDNLSQQGMCDWRFQGRQLQVYVADNTMGTTEDWVKLQAGVDIAGLPIKASIEGLVNKALIIGDAGVTLELTNAGIAMPWGNWEASISNGGVNDPDTMNLLGTAMLEDSGAEKVQLTAELKMDTLHYTPLVDFVPGQYISSPGESGYDSFRVRQINGRTSSDNKTKIDLVLNDRFMEREIRNAKKVNGIVGGSSAGGSGGRPIPPGDDRSIPKQVVGLVVNTTAYLDAQGKPQAYALASWSAVTESTQNMAMEISRYEVYIREAVVGVNWRLQTATTDTSTRISPLPVGVEYQLAVIAVAEPGERRGAPSVFYGFITASDTTPPPRPSAPILSSRMGAIVVRWDGLTFAGGTMPIDFDRIDVYRLGTGGNPHTVIGAIRASAGENFLVVTDQAYGDLIEYFFRAIDTSGNLSIASPTSSITVQALIDTDIIGEIISGANIVDGSLVASDKIVANSITGGLIAALAVETGHLAANAVTAAKIAAGAITTAKLDALAVTTAKLDALAVTAEKIAANAITAVKIDAGAITAEKIAARAITADKIDAGAVTAQKVSLGVVGMNLVQNAGFEDVGIQPPPIGAVRATAPGWEHRARGSGQTNVFYLTGSLARSGWGYMVAWSGTTASNGAQLVSDWIVVTPGRQYRLGAWVRNIQDTCAANLAIHTRTTGGTVSGVGLAQIAPATNVWADLTYLWTCPSDVVEIQLVVTNNNTASPATGKAIVVDDAYVIPVGAAVTELTPGSLRMWDSTGALTIDLNGDSGMIVGKTLVGGLIQTSTSGYRVELNGPSNQLRFLSGDTVQGYIRAIGPGIDIYSSFGVDMRSHINMGAGQSIYLSLTSDLRFGGVGQPVLSRDSANRLQLSSSAGLNVSSGTQNIFGMGSTTSSANVYSAGNTSALQRSSSLRRLKHYREEIPAHYAVLDLPPMTWLEQHAEDPAPRPGRIAGFVAEDVATVSAFHGGVLDPLLVIDEDGDLQGLAYDRIIAYLIPVVRDIHERLRAIEQVGD